MLLLLLAPFAFSPLAIGRWLLLSAPLLGEIVFMRPGITRRAGSARIICSAADGDGGCRGVGIARYPRFTRAVVPCALVVMLLIFNDTVLRVGAGRLDWSAYQRAVAVRDVVRRR